MYQPIVEDNNGTYIFAGEIFFPFKVLNEFLNKGMEYFIIDKSFVNLNNVEEMVYNSINGKDINDNNKMGYYTSGSVVQKSNGWGTPLPDDIGE